MLIGCKKFIHLLAICLLVVTMVAAQNETSDSYVNPGTDKKNTSPQSDFADKLMYGGSFGAFFGRQTYIELCPKVGYKVDKRLVAGVGANYIYFSVRDYGQRFVTHIYGPNVFAQYALVSGLFAYGEFNAFNVASYNPLPPYATERMWVGSAPVGLGYFSGGQIGGVYLSALYDLINNPYSPYYNGSVPILFRVGFLF
ncbi:MAG: hypothetical protein ACK46S_06900 [Bacteroidota bacterium]|jgi:hypothetical protein